MSLVDYLLNPDYQGPTDATTAYLLGLKPKQSDDAANSFWGEDWNWDIPGFHGPEVKGPSVTLGDTAGTPGADITAPTVDWKPAPLPGSYTIPGGLGDVSLPAIDLPEFSWKPSPAPGSYTIPKPDITLPNIPLPPISTPIGLPSVGIPSVGLPGINLPSIPNLPLKIPGVDVGDWNDVINKIQPGLGLVNGKLTFNPTPEQTLEIAKSISDVAGRSGIDVVSKIGSALSNAFGNAGGALSGITSLVSQWAYPAQFLYNAGKTAEKIGEVGSAIGNIGNLLGNTSSHAGETYDGKTKTWRKSTAEDIQTSKNISESEYGIRAGKANKEISDWLSGFSIKDKPNSAAIQKKTEEVNKKYKTYGYDA